MLTIVVYDVSVDKVNKVCKILRQYMNWVQNSVFEGDLTKNDVKEIEDKVKGLIDIERDSIIFYFIENENFIKKMYLGKKKANLSKIL